MRSYCDYPVGCHGLVANSSLILCSQRDISLGVQERASGARDDFARTLTHYQVEEGPERGDAAEVEENRQEPRNHDGVDERVVLDKPEGTLLPLTLFNISNKYSI